ncbi:hypothetical protein L1987_64567 [Smallanthus sonchifolius]|uniref:Uncharacterized protein n=1 Tax=Smallanthus sonchifolius TaxID=185202 RepID=A0ACB9BS40_9ASTR|nr:hypothetical protein L1987_64567 [Smallanthus sonchifolius]
MESPTLWLTLLLFPLGQHSSNPKSLTLISPFLLHYIHRTIIYPLRLRRKRSNGYPIAVALIAFVYNLFNSYLQARWVSEYADYENDKWFWWRFGVGLGVFVGGMVVNVKSDMELLKLKEGGGGYKIPRGGFFEFVSCANYFGEIVEWVGWWVMTGSWVGLGFLVYTCANLVPRARANHVWGCNTDHVYEVVQLQSGKFDLSSSSPRRRLYTSGKHGSPYSSLNGAISKFS